MAALSAFAFVAIEERLDSDLARLQALLSNLTRPAGRGFGPWNGHERQNEKPVRRDGAAARGAFPPAWSDATSSTCGCTRGRRQGRGVAVLRSSNAVWTHTPLAAGVSDESHHELWEASQVRRCRTLRCLGARSKTLGSRDPGKMCVHHVHVHVHVHAQHVYVHVCI